MPFLFTAIFLAFFVLPPQAKEPPSIAATQQDPRFHAAVEKQFLAYEASLTMHCKDIHPDWSRATRTFYTSYGPMTLDKDGHPYNATWAVHVPGTACGEPRRFRAQILVREGKLNTARLLPGDSETSAQLEADVRDPLLTAAAGFARDIRPSCAIDVLDTRIFGKGEPPAPWQEMWLVNICGHRLNVPITFIPDTTGTGTSYSISSHTITEAQ